MNSMITQMDNHHIFFRIPKRVFGEYAKYHLYQDLVFALQMKGWALSDGIVDAMRALEESMEMDSTFTFRNTAKYNKLGERYITQIYSERKPYYVEVTVTVD